MTEIKGRSNYFFVLDLVLAYQCESYKAYFHYVSATTHIIDIHK